MRVYETATLSSSLLILFLLVGSAWRRNQTVYGAWGFVVTANGKAISEKGICKRRKGLWWRSGDGEDGSGVGGL